MNALNFYENIFDTTPAAIVVISAQGRIRACNKAFETFSDYESSELADVDIRTLCHPDEFKELRRKWVSVIEGDTTGFRMTGRFYSAKAEVLWADIWGKPAVESGLIVGVTITAFEVTRQCRIQAALKSPDQRHALLSINGGAALVIDEAMNIIRVNDYANRLSGYSRKEFREKPFFPDHVHPEDIAKLAEYHRERRENPTSVPGEYSCRLLHRDGRTVRCKLSVTLIPKTKRSMVTLDGPRDEYEDVLRKSYQLQMLSLLYENSKDQIFMADLDANITYISPSVEKVTGYSQEEVKLLSPDEYFTPFSLKMSKTFIQKGLERHCDISKPILLEYSFFHKNGSIIWLELLAQFIVSEYGQPIGIAGSSRDITERKKAEEALRESEAKYRQLTEGLKDVVLVVLPDMTIEYISPVIRELSGYQPDEITGTHVRHLFKLPKEYDRAVELFNIIMEEKKPTTNYEFLFVAGGREDFYVELTAKPLVQDGEVIKVQCVARDISERKAEEEKQRQREKSLNIENCNLKRSILQGGRFGNIIGKSKPMLQVYEMLLRAAPSELHTVILGESGTGKELAARALHTMSRRSKQTFVPVNCGAIPETVMESAFFGYKKGAFTGADRDKDGFFDLADGGTLFLDEVGEIGLSMQVKLLRAIEGGGYTPVGSTRVKNADIRIIAATNKDPERLVDEGKMRADFYFRINIIRVQLPPLRERKEDIPLLIDHFLKLQKDPKGGAVMPDRVIRNLTDYDWPGNVRELQNVVNQYIALNRIDFPGNRKVKTIYPAGGAAAIREDETLATILSKIEKQILYDRLIENGWNKSRVAKRLNIDRKTLASKIKKYGLDPEVA